MSMKTIDEAGENGGEEKRKKANSRSGLRGDTLTKVKA